MPTSLELKAAAFATKAHEGQVRKYTGEPYINHPAAVAELVATVPHTEYMIAAAWLHDVVEDTGVTQDEIFYQFGVEVSLLVQYLTDVSIPSDGNRARRKEIDRLHLAAAPPDAMTIKLADLIHNTESILKYDKKFAKVYLAEKLLLIKVLRGGAHRLRRQAFLLAHQGLKELKENKMPMTTHTAVMLDDDLPIEVKRVTESIVAGIQEYDGELMYDLDETDVRQLVVLTHKQEDDYEDAYILCTNYEDGGSSTVFRNGQWFYRDSWTGNDRPVPGGEGEVVGNWICHFTG